MSSVECLSGTMVFGCIVVGTMVVSVGDSNCCVSVGNLIVSAGVCVVVGTAVVVGCMVVCSMVVGIVVS